MALNINWAYNSSDIGPALRYIGADIKVGETETDTRAKVTSLNRISDSADIIDNLLRIDTDVMLMPYQQSSSLISGNKAIILCVNILQRQLDSKWIAKPEAVWYPINYTTAVKTILKQLGLEIKRNEDKVYGDILEKMAATRNYGDRGVSGAVENTNKWYMSLNTAQKFADAFSDLGYYSEGTEVDPSVVVGYLINPAEQPPEVCSYNDMYRVICNKVSHHDSFKRALENGLSFGQLWNTAVAGTNLSNYDYVVMSISNVSYTNDIELRIMCCNFADNTTYAVTQSATQGVYNFTPSLAQGNPPFDDRCKWIGAKATFYENHYNYTTISPYHFTSGELIGTIVSESPTNISALGSTLLSRASGEKDVDWIDATTPHIPTREAHNITTMYPNLDQLQIHGFTGSSYPSVNYIEMPLSVMTAIGEANWQVARRDWDIATSLTDDPIDDPPSPTPPYVPDGPDDPPAEENPNKLFTVSVINDSNLATLGSFLWSSTFIDAIKNMFTTPIQAVLGLHVLHHGGSIPQGGAAEIKLGSIRSGAQGNPVTNRYFNFSCGSVDVPEYYHNIADYKGFTSASILLPYIGIQDLDINQIMGHKVTVEYGVDAYTGSCIARLYINNGATLKGTEIGNYYGQCGVQLPVTSMDYGSMINAALKGISGAVGGLIGGNLGAAAGSMLNTLGSFNTKVSSSNGFNNNVGPLGRQKPRILLQRANAFNPTNFNRFYGYPSNKTVSINSLSGYARVKEVHLDSVTCTDTEKTEIDTLLKSGVIF